MAKNVDFVCSQSWFHKFYKFCLYKLRQHFYMTSTFNLSCLLSNHVLVDSETEESLKNNWKIIKKSLKNHGKIIEESLKNCWKIIEESLKNPWKTMEESWKNYWSEEYFCMVVNN